MQSAGITKPSGMILYVHVSDDLLSAKIYFSYAES